MSMINNGWLRVAALTSAAALLLLAHGCTGVVIKTAMQEISMTSCLTYHAESIYFENEERVSVSELTLCYTEGFVAHRSYYTVKLEGGVEVHDWTPVLSEVEGVACVSVPLDNPLTKGSVAHIETYSVLSHAQEPYPAAIFQSEDQYVRFNSTVVLISPYTVEEQQLKVMLPSTNVVSYTTEQAAKKKGRDITYGPYGGTKPWTVVPLHLHFEQNSPFVTFTNVRREYEVSHWGRIYVEEDYDLVHTGAALKGEWSRMEYMDAQSSPSMFAVLGLQMPRAAHTPYFRDAIGNVSSSAVRYNDESVTAALRMRFPLFGGWRSSFTWGYSLPLEGSLTGGPGGRLRLALPLRPPLLEDFTADGVEVRVVLPEGSSDIEFKAPAGYEVDVGRDVKYSYLDVTGRPVVVLRMTNVVRSHNEPAYIFYRPGSMMMEPMLLIIAYACLFVAAMAYVRCDFVLSKDASWRAEQAHEMAFDAVHKLRAILADETRLLEGLDAVLKEHVAKDAAKCKEEARITQAGLGRIKKVVDEMVVALDALDSSVAQAAGALCSRRQEVADKTVALAAKRIEIASKPASDNQVAIDAANKELARLVQDVTTLQNESDALEEALMSHFYDD